MITFDSDLLELCYCGRQTLLVEFFVNGDWVIRCHCGQYWPSQGDQEKNPMASLL